MEIVVTRDDGTSVDVTAQVRLAYDLLWEGTRWDRDWTAEDLDGLVALARALDHPSAGLGAEIAASVRSREEEQRAQTRAWQRQRAESVVEGLAALG